MTMTNLRAKIISAEEMAAWRQMEIEATRAAHKALASYPPAVQARALTWLVAHLKMRVELVPPAPSQENDNAQDILGEGGLPTPSVITS